MPVVDPAVICETYEKLALLLMLAQVTLIGVRFMNSVFHACFAFVYIICMTQAYNVTRGLDMQAAQQATGVPLADTTAILNYTEQTYLKRAISSFTDCAAFTPSISGTTGLETVDLEKDAAEKAGIRPSPKDLFPETPLANVTQGSTNMCSAFAFAQAWTIKYALQNAVSPPQLSPTVAYFFQRVEECKTTGTCACPACASNSTTCTSCEPPCVDCGSYMQSALTVYMGGVCSSSTWPLTQPMNEAPSAAARTAATRRVASYQCITLSSVLQALQADAPVIVMLSLTPPAVTWLQSLINYAASTPLENDDAVVFKGASAGATAEALGHVVTIVGYAPSTKRFLVRNSFGFAWGNNGRFTIQDTDMTAANITQAIAVVAVA